MNRDIQFRGKSKRTGIWEYGPLIEAQDGSYIVNNFINYGFQLVRSPYVSACFHQVIPETVGQYTNIGIESGREKQRLYEDDILDVVWYPDAKSPMGPERYVVTWDNEAWGWTLAVRLKGGRRCHPFIAMPQWNGPDVAAKLVGNMHDNPELAVWPKYERQANEQA